jgi:ribosomal protein S20
MNRSYSKIRHIQESNKNLEKRFLSEQKSDKETLDEQTVAGTIGNVVEIGVDVIKNLINAFPGSRVRQLRRAARKAAEAGDTTDFNTLLDQVKFNRKEDRQKLKNALVKGDVSRNLKNLWGKIKKQTDSIAAPFEKGMGNQKPQNTTTTPTQTSTNTIARQI